MIKVLSLCLAVAVYVNLIVWLSSRIPALLIVVLAVMLWAGVVGVVHRDYLQKERKFNE